MENFAKFNQYDSSNTSTIQLYFKTSNVYFTTSDSNTFCLMAYVDTSSKSGDLSTTEYQNLGMQSQNFSTPITINYDHNKRQRIVISAMTDTGEISEISQFFIKQLLTSNSNSIILQFNTNICRGTIEIYYEGDSKIQKTVQKSREYKHLFEKVISKNININMIACIDFTASNGYAHLPQSLHNLNGGLNDYQMVLKSIGKALMNYDSNKIIQVYGFGGSPDLFPMLNLPRKQVSHFFPLSGDWNNCAGIGIEGALNIYSSAVGMVSMSGPTHFAPMFRETVNFAKMSFEQDPRNYIIVLIITDGVMHDRQETVNEIVKGSSLPISFVIVGVGSADFSEMDNLANQVANGKLKDDNGNRAARDIINFFPFENFKSSGVESLMGEVMSVIPDQICEFLEVVAKNNQGQGMSRMERRRQNFNQRRMKRRASAMNFQERQQISMNNARMKMNPFNQNSSMGFQRNNNFNQYQRSNTPNFNMNQRGSNFNFFNNMSNMNNFNAQQQQQQQNQMIYQAHVRSWNQKMNEYEIFRQKRNNFNNNNNFGNANFGYGNQNNNWNMYNQQQQYGFNNGWTQQGNSYGGGYW